MKMHLNRNGFSIPEVFISLMLFSILSSAIGFSYLIGTKAFRQGHNRASIRKDIGQAMEVAVKNLRQAKSIDSLTQSSVTFTVDLGSGDETFHIYLYNENDAEPNPPYTQSSYNLRFIRGSDTYGEGAVLAKNITTPTNIAFSQVGNLISLDWTALKNGASIRLQSSVRPRNL
jgi:type II secretory pathway pseudopilin PulG